MPGAVRRALLWLSAGVFVTIPGKAVVSTLIAAQDPSAGASVELRPGVLIDPQGGVAYVMRPQGGIEAIALTRGEPVWTSKEAARPLAIAGDLLVAQAEPPSRGNELVIVTLDRKAGARVATARAALPAGTLPSVVDTAGGAFAIAAYPTGREALLSWEFSARPMQGVAPGTLDPIPPAAPQPGGARQVPETQPPDASKARVSRGAVRIDLASGKVVAAKPDDAPAQVTRPTPDARSEELLASAAGQQFLSVDGRHVLSSERVADDSVWDKYQWTILERASKKRLGTLRSYRSHAPFLVTDTQLIYEIGPYTRRTDRRMVEVPLGIRAVDLRTGAELWTRPVRDTAFRGPFPP